jgi:hypothetical protein
MPDGVQTIDFYGYSGCVALQNADTRVVLGHHAGGRVLQYAWRGANALYLDPAGAGQTYPLDASAARGERAPSPTGGRADIGPEHVTPRHPLLWLGPWSVAVVGPMHARMTSQDDPATGVRLVRDFVLDDTSSALTFTQTIVNVSSKVTQWCHWSRTFTPHGGIGILPLAPAYPDVESAGVVPASRFPHCYVQYVPASGGPGRAPGAIAFRPDDPQITRHTVDGRDYLVIRPTPQHPKLGFDSYAGVMGYLLPRDPAGTASTAGSDGLLFLKRYETHPDRIYNEVAAITACIYYPAEHFVELEPIGPRETLEPGESASFTEEWQLLPFPSPTAAAHTAGAPVDLAAFAAHVTPAYVPPASVPAA